MNESIHIGATALCGVMVSVIGYLGRVLLNDLRDRVSEVEKKADQTNEDLREIIGFLKGKPNGFK